jgi:hypothetical protein
MGNDLGGSDRLSEGQRQLIRRAATLSIMSESVELAAAKKQRETVLNDIRKANAAVDAGDQRARMELPGLNKQDVAAGRLILSIEKEVIEAKKRLDMAENQAATAAARRASADAVAVPRDKLFEVETPDGRRVGHCSPDIRWWGRYSG